MFNTLKSLFVKPEPSISEIIEKDLYTAQAALLKAYGELELAKARVSMYESAVARLSASKCSKGVSE